MSARWILRRSLTILLLLLAGAAEASPRQVVLLESSERGNLVLDRFTAVLRVLLGEHSTDPLTLTEFVVTPAGFSDAPEQAMVEFLRTAFAGKPQPDLVITIGGAAAAFFQRHRAQLFPDSPILYASLDQRFLTTGFTERETAAAVAIDPTGRIDDIMRLLPETQNVFVVVGGGALGTFWRGVLGRESGKYRDLQFLWADGMTYAEILQRVSTLPSRSVVFFTSTFEVDTDGATYSTERVLADLRARANAPIFGFLSTELGHGAIGGRLIDVDALGQTAADIAFRILQGETPAHIKAPVLQPGGAVFDWRELQRWNISEDRLPAGSSVLFREPGVWQRYKWPIVGSAAAMVAQSLLIAGLLVSRVRRRRAEQSLRAARETLSSLNRRLIVAQEQERSRLARELHDDVCQQLALLALDLDRLGKSLPESEEHARQEARELSELARALTSHLGALAYQLHSSKLDVLGLGAAAAAFCKEVSTRTGMIVEFTHDNVPAKLPPDIALNLFRVLQESLSNATKHSGASECHVTLLARDGELRLEVRDEGKGFDTNAAATSSGLGLISMEERLNLVNGSISIDSTVGAGTMVRATVPLNGPPPLTA